MHQLLQLVATATFFTATLAHAQFHMPQLTHKEKETREDLSWLAPFATPAPEGQAAALVHDPRFKPFLREHLTTRQVFWNENQPLPETILDFLGNPNRVLLDNNRYLIADGCVAEFCPSRGMLFIDLGTAHPLVVFAALDWVKESKTTDQLGAEYTLWLFSNHSSRAAQSPTQPPTQSAAQSADQSAAVPQPDPGKETMSLPTALVAAIARWSAQPIPGSNTLQSITHAVIVDPDGAGHQVPPAAIGAVSPKPATNHPQPGTQPSTQPSTGQIQ